MLQEDKLKVAILDYLKRYHPADTDTLTMVSLHYTLYLQIAQALEERAQGILSALTTKTLSTSRITISETVRLGCIQDALYGMFSVILLYPSLPEGSARVMHLGLFVCLSARVTPKLFFT